MKLILSPRASKYFKPLMLILTFLGIIAGLIIPAVTPSLRNSVLIWILAPIILAAMFDCLLVGFYFIFLNKGGFGK